MKSTDVAMYLQNNPLFFEENLDLLAEIILPHPHGGRTISLSERQLLTLREKNKLLERNLHDLVAAARDNDALQQKVHQFSCALLGYASLPDVAEVIIRNLREIFSVPHVALQLWQVQPPSAEVLTFADQQVQPVCVHHALHDTLQWFGEGATHLRSFSYLPLRVENQSIGLLVLASEEAQRFYPEMGTLFLQRIAEIVSCAVAAHPK